jgi:hypothetical protein
VGARARYCGDGPDCTCAAISTGANVNAVLTMLGHASAVLTLDPNAEPLRTIWGSFGCAGPGPCRAGKSTVTGCGPAQKKAPNRIPDQGLSSAKTRVGVAGFEPTTSSSRTKHATKLRHTPREAPTAYRTSLVGSQTRISAAQRVGDLKGRDESGVSVTLCRLTIN